jgi:hypothetical protein
MNTDSNSAKLDDFAGPPDAMPDRLRAAPFFQRTDWLSFGTTTLLALLVYLFTLVPAVGLD